MSEICIPLRKLFASIFLCCLFTALSSFAGLPVRATAAANVSITTTESASSILYTTLELESLGLSKKAFEYAYKGYQNLLEKKLVNTTYLTICDFSQSSKQKRLYVIDLTNNEVVMNTYVAHGRNSGLDYATRFSNKPESLQSSLGFFVTRQTYTGENGLSLKLQGLEPGFNDKAYERAIVIHGADYIGAEKTGRSFGCPAVPANESAALINTIKNGNCLFIYHPATNYLKRSKILNG
jgi:hypothetical protein